MRAEVSYMVRLFFRPIIALCFFILCAEGYTVCPRPFLPMNVYIEPEKEFYNLSEIVHFKCSRRHHLFGNINHTCLLNGKWSGNMPYCAKSSNKVKLMENEEEYGILLDRKGRSCLSNFSITSLRKFIYIQVDGFHPLAVVKISPEPPYDTIFYEVFYYNYSSGIHNYQDLSSYVGCLKDLYTTTFNCDFGRPLENPIIYIKIGDESKECISCLICEVNIFLNNEENSQECFSPQIEHAYWNKSDDNIYSIRTKLEVECEDGYESSSNIKSVTCENDGQWSSLNCKEIPSEVSNMVLIYVSSAGVFIFFSLIVIVFIVLRKRKNKVSEAEKKTEQENQYEQVNENMNTTYPVMNHFRAFRRMELDSCRTEKEDECKQANEDRHIVYPELTNCTNQELQPIYINELLPPSVCSYPLSEEAGYLVPIMNNREDFPTDKREEIGNQTADMNIYCTIHDLSPKVMFPEVSTSNLYANL